MLAALYPPTSGAVPAAAMRTRGLCRALVQLGHHVDVVCAMPAGTTPVALDGVTVRPARWIDPEWAVRRLRGGGAPKPAQEAQAGQELAKKLIPPDRYFTWIPSGGLAGRRLTRRADLVMSTSAKSAHLAGRIASRGLPWIADLNDPWTDNPQVAVGAIRGMIDRRLESMSLAQATHITTVTPPLRDALAARFGADRVTTLLSGCELDLDLEVPVSPPSDRCVLLYAGTLYPAFDLSALYQAIAAERDAGTITAENFAVRFVGRLNTRVRSEAASHGVEEFFEVGGLVPRTEILPMMAGATALLLPLYEGDPFALPMKFFEYVGAGRPILAVGPKDRFAAQAVSENELGVVASTVDETRAVIRRLAADPAGVAGPARASRERFSWDHAAGTLEGVIDQVMSERRRG